MQKSKQAIISDSIANGVPSEPASDTRLRRSLLVLSVALLGILPLVGCAAGQDDGEAFSGTANAAKNTPPIHVSQTSVLLHNGELAVAQTYREALANCSEDLTPLPDDVVAKLGRTYLETSYEGARMSVKADRWDFRNKDDAAGCQFEPVHESKLTIIAPGAATTVDLTAKTATRQDSPGVMREATVQDAKATQAATDDDAKMRAAVMAELEKKGQGDLMAQSEGAATIAGQPCVQSKNAQAESCVWSGGAQWGFVTDTSATADRMDAPVDNIPLSVKPADGEGYRLTTQSMSVGIPIDGSVFKLPSNIAVKPAS
jgi:hypothetical protein